MSLEIASKLAILLNETESSNELRQLWEALDKNSDGKVSSKEWGSAVFQNKDLLSKYFGGASMSEIGHAFNRIDSNKVSSLPFSSTVQSTYKNPSCIRNSFLFIIELISNMISIFYKKITRVTLSHGTSFLPTPSLSPPLPTWLLPWRLKMDLQSSKVFGIPSTRTETEKSPAKSGAELCTRIRI